MSRSKQTLQDGSAEYDAAGNMRSIVTSYLPVQADGSLSGTATSQSWWYRYDSMSRLVMTKGMPVGPPLPFTAPRSPPGP